MMYSRALTPRLRFGTPERQFEKAIEVAASELPLERSGRLLVKTEEVDH